ncbi:MAG TPA: type IV pilin N-terminal domain-containing protein [Candidatus Methanoperedens sp.]
MKQTRSEDAVSPVIGVILMVVITVIIAAILAVFAFGIGGPNKAPEAQLKYVVNASTSGNTTVTIINTGGDSLILKDERISASFAANNSNVISPTTMDIWVTNPAGSQYLAPGKSVSGFSTNNTLIGDIITIQVLDVPTGQLISNAKVTVQ